jgi:hypothetical protein
LDEDQKEIDEDLAIIDDLLGIKKPSPPPPPPPEPIILEKCPEENKRELSGEKLDGNGSQDDEKNTPGYGSPSNGSQKAYSGDIKKSEEKVEEIVIKTPEPPAAPQPPPPPPREPTCIENLFKEYVIDIIKDIIAGFIEVFTEIYVFIRDYGKPVPPTPLEALLAKHQAIDKKYKGITEKYWDTNAHLLDDDLVF